MQLWVLQQQQQCQNHPVLLVRQVGLWEQQQQEQGVWQRWGNWGQLGLCSAGGVCGSSCLVLPHPEVHHLPPAPQCHRSWVTCSLWNLSTTTAASLLTWT